MANLKSAKTRVRRNQKRESVNAKRLNSTRTAVKKTRAAIAKGDKEAATRAFRQAESSLAKAKNKRTIKANTMARQVSRLAQALKSLVGKK